MNSIFKSVVLLFASVSLNCSDIAAYRDEKQTFITPQPLVNISDKRKIVTVLSIDGGGVRGIIVAMILDYIEKNTKSPIALSFDVISGISTGGIIALMLNVPDKKTGNPKYSCNEVVDLYRKISVDIFYRSFNHRLKTLNGLIGPKYPQEYIKQKLQQYLGDSRMRDAIGKYLIIPAYNLTLGRLWFFTKFDDKHEYNEHFMREVGLATSAAPTYFPHVTIMDYNQDENKHVKYDFIDSSVIISNPVFPAFMSAIHDFDKDSDLYIISIGTGSFKDKTIAELHKIYGSGKISWSTRIISLMLEGANKESHMQINDIFLALKHYQLQDFSVKNYIRLNPELDDRYSEIDNVKNIKELEKIAENFIKNSKKELDYIVNLINKRNEQIKQNKAK